MDCREISQEELDQIIQDRDALRAQVATLSAGKAWIPEPTDEDWKESIRVSKVLAWAREHAVAPVVVPTMDWEEVNSRSRLNFEDDDTLSPVIYANGYAKGYSDLASLIRPIPTDRILQDGQVEVGIHELRMLRDFAARRMSQREYDRLEACRDAHEDALRAKNAGEV